MIKLFFIMGWCKNTNAVMKMMNSLTPGTKGIWGKLNSTDKLSDADWVIALQTTPDSGVNTMVFVQEPPCIQQLNCSNKKYKHIYTYTNLYHVFTNIFLLGGDQSRTGTIHNFDYWNNLTYIKERKTKQVSIITSSKQMTPAHKYRYSLTTKLLNSDIDIDIYGRDLPFKNIKYKGKLDGKIDGLLNYNYSICIENCSIPNYFTEKFTDAILCWTIPIYWGCSNIEKYFPHGSYYIIDIQKGDILNQIKDIIQKPITIENINAMAEARRRILYEYNIWPTIEKILQN